MNLSTITLLLIVVLVLAVWAAWEFGRGLDQRKALAERGTRGYDQRRMSTALDRLDARLRRTTIGRQIARRLVASGLRIRLSTLVLGVGGGGAAIGLLLGRFLSPLLGVVIALGVGAATFGYMRHQEDRRREEFVGQLPELARVLGNATGAGLSIRTAIEMAADELDEPARTELSRSAEALRLGQSFDDAMNDLRDRLPSRELAVLVSTLVVSSRSGGSLITSLRNISTTLEQRKETRREVKTILGQSVVAGWAIAGMGGAMLLGIAVLNPAMLDRMTGSVVGSIILAIVIGLFAGALVLIRRMTRIDV
ncbi:type II secretion system F family protein [Actinomadura sp. HBU206391]|uniref:type II secretion system F family protein n=1 Tax=Actinomadura sp. HBU206391 TaxID=2731692 RepID=UPI00164FA05D|nr:type II secretion system F family protein [Actinomadura sp. HBU206391]MBC6461869.1 type II secretion system F family protein [Actinomadura sp. HBU206391]